MSEPLPEGVTVGGAAAMPEAPEEVTEMKQPKLSKIEEKRQQIFRDRVRRKMGDGKTEEQAIQAIMQEDYEAMPLDKKFARLESAVANAINGLMHNVNTIRQNEHVVADAFDINYRALAKMMAKLGLSQEEQNAIIDETKKEVEVGRQAELAERQKAQEAAAKAASEQSVVSTELNQVEQKPLQTAASTDERPEGTDPHVEAGATEFGS